MTAAACRVPGAAAIPDGRIVHMETRSRFAESGMKGVGESGAIGPPAAIANAFNDAVKGLGAELLETPMTRRRVVEAIRAVRAPQ